MEPSLHRVLVVGTSGCGKTTFARKLAGALDQPHVELDPLHWLPGWVERSELEFRQLVERAAAGERWVIDGNYREARDAAWPRATSVFWLNYSFATVFSRGLRRTFRRALTAEPLYWDNRETLTRSLLRRDSILWWIISTFRRRRREYAEVRATNWFPQLVWFELRDPAAADRALRELQVERRNRQAIRGDDGP